MYKDWWEKKNLQEKNMYKEEKTFTKAQKKEIRKKKVWIDQTQKDAQNKNEHRFPQSKWIGPT